MYLFLPCLLRTQLKSCRLPNMSVAAMRESQRVSTSLLERPIFFRKQRQDHGKSTALSYPTVNLKMPAMLLHQRACKKKPQPESRRCFFLPSLVRHTGEGFPDA